MQFISKSSASFLQFLCKFCESYIQAKCNWSASHILLFDLWTKDCKRVHCVSWGFLICPKRGSSRCCCYPYQEEEQFLFFILCCIVANLVEVSKYCIVQKSRKKLPPADSKVKVRFKVQTCISQFPLPAGFPKTYDSTIVFV